jgi:hypothetical protein
MSQFEIAAAQVSTTDVAKLVSQAWKEISDEERDTWEELARKDKARYEMEKSMYTGPWKVPAMKRSQKDPNAPKRPMSVSTIVIAIVHVGPVADHFSHYAP